MTYTFKLARRLAVSRTFSMLPALMLIAACSGSDATAPEGSNPSTSQDDWRPREIAPVTVRVNPSTVTVETNQLIRFMAHGRTGAGDSVGAPVTWNATGGTILPDGRFYSAAVGSFTITGTTRSQGEDRIDTALALVVRRRPTLQSMTVTPASVTLAPGGAQPFTVTGRLKEGRVVAVGAIWYASGGTIDAGGNYVAGDTAGTYQVIATNTSMTIADTSSVTIGAPATPPPPPAGAPPVEPPRPPAATLEKVTLVPASATLATRATKQFKAYGRMSDGDSVAVNVVFVATGGAVNTGGLYTAGSTAGSFRVIATSGALADTSSITVTVPLGSGTQAGIPFGNWDTKITEFGAPYTGSVKILSPTDIRSYLDEARARKTRVVVFFAGGPRNYMNADSSFSMTLWKQRVARFQGIDLSSYVADGTVVGHVLLDEPFDPSNWGGTPVTLAQIDEMARYSKQLYPKLPTTIRSHPAYFKGHPMQYLDAAWAQYSARKGDVTTYLRGNIAAAKESGLGLIVGLNIIHGGDGSSGLLGSFPGISPRPGQYTMSAAEIRRYGTVLASDPFVCGFMMWKYVPEFAERPEIRSAMTVVAAVATNRVATSCRNR